MSVPVSISEPATARPSVRPARATWLWWGVVAGASGLAGNFVSSHPALTDVGAEEALASVGRGAYHLSTLLGIVSFVALLVLTAGWLRWSSGQHNLAGWVAAAGFATTSALVLLGTGLRGGLAEYSTGGINDDNFPAEGLYVLFMVHDTAPWFAWWGVLVAAGAAAYLAFRTAVLPTWLGVISVLALVMPVAVMVGSGAVAAAGFVGPAWLVVSSVTLALRGLDRT